MDDDMVQENIFLWLKFSEHDYNDNEELTWSCALFSAEIQVLEWPLSPQASTSPIHLNEQSEH